jgi:hypothetical protein
MGNPFPLNAWYAAAWSHEVSARGVLARTVCNQNIVLWRTSEGEISAVVEAQQRAITASPAQPLHNLNVDAGALWARRIIERLSAEG